MEFQWSQDAQISFERFGVLAPSRAEVPSHTHSSCRGSICF